MFTKPPLVPVLAGIWALPILLGLVFNPFGAWAMYLPKPAEAALRLREAEYFNTSLRCGSGEQDDWLEVAASQHAGSWFRALAIEGIHPAARLYGLVGLYAVDPAGFALLVGTHPRFAPDDSLPVITEARYTVARPDDFLRQPTLDSIVTLFSNSKQGPICD